MKKILYPVVLLAALLGAYSCDLDRFPEGLTDQDNDFQSMDDIRAHRNSIYIGLRSIFSGSNVYTTDIQSDLLHASTSFGNSRGDFYKWTMLYDNSTIATCWSGPYNLIAEINYILDNKHKVEPANSAEQKEMDLYIAEIHLARAMMYRQLILRYAKDYEPATAATDPGVPIMLHYNIDAQMPRATVAEVYEQILNDIELAKGGLTTKGTQNSKYLTKDCILALESQVYLEMHRYQEAADVIEPLINSSTYSLITNRNTLKTMWTNDSGSEIIFQPYSVDNTQAPGSMGEYIGYNGKVYIPNYIPEQWVVDLFGEDDIRRGVFIAQYAISLENTVYPNIWLISKYPTNPNLQSGLPNYCNMPKIFRLAELYLITAEALAYKGGSDAAALKALNTLRDARNIGKLSVGTSGDELKKAIQEERTREMLCEGTRLYDLKRWKKDLVRKAPQNSKTVLNSPADQTTQLYKIAGNNLFVWGIPKQEIQTNACLKNNQNPGW